MTVKEIGEMTSDIDKAYSLISDLLHMCRGQSIFIYTDELNDIFKALNSTKSFLENLDVTIGE